MVDEDTSEVDPDGCQEGKGKTYDCSTDWKYGHQVNFELIDQHTDQNTNEDVDYVFELNSFLDIFVHYFVESYPSVTFVLHWDDQVGRVGRYCVDYVYYLEGDHRPLTFVEVLA